MTITSSSVKPIALITGAASGLGLDLARELARSHRLVLVDIQQEALNKHGAEFPDVQCFTCDLADGASIEALVGQIKMYYRCIDLLINNAGITHRSVANTTDIDVIQKVMAVDYLAPVQLTQGLLPLLNNASSATVVNIGSMAGWMPVLGRAGYCAAKSALHQYFETWRAEQNKDSRVRLLMVYPSFIDTPITRNALNGQGGKATHERSTTGKMQSSSHMAKVIINATQSHKARLFPDFFTSFSSLLYRLMPSLYLRLMRNRLQVELR